MMGKGMDLRSLFHSLAGTNTPAEDAAPAASPDAESRARVLCIDDNPDFLRSLARQLEREYDVILAGGPEEGIDAIRDKGPFDVIICDLRMPKVKGVSYLNRLRDEAPGTERLILTGWADPVTMAVAAQEGRAMRLLAKPCPPQVLRQAISDALLRRRARLLARASLS